MCKRPQGAEITTDKELLELAAKAAGMTLTLGGYLEAIREDENGRVWNPLTDDGDALRLAVKLSIDVNINSMKVKVCDRSSIKPRYIVIEIEKGKDPYAATRRAIVRAAAEIGKGMK